MSPTAEFVGSLVAGLAVIIGLIVLVMKLAGKSEPRTISPQPLRVKAEPDFTTEANCRLRYDELNERIEAVEKRATDNQNLIREELKVLRRGNDYVQRRVNGMATTVYAIAGKMGIVGAGAPPMEEPT